MNLLAGTVWCHRNSAVELAARLCTNRSLKYNEVNIEYRLTVRVERQSQARLLGAQVDKGSSLLLV